MMQATEIISGVAAVIDKENIDTDQIIPAEHLKITNKSGLGKHLFANWRYLANHEENAAENVNFVLNQSPTRNAKILIAGDNFGCGSSREHAPWALLDFGIQVIISSSIADIFRNNSIKNGLLPIVVDQQTHEYLLKQNAQQIKVDIKNRQIEVNDQTFNFEIEAFTRYCFLQGIDQLQFLLNQQDLISQFEKKHKRYTA